MQTHPRIVFALCACAVVVTACAADDSPTVDVPAAVEELTQRRVSFESLPESRSGGPRAIRSSGDFVEVLVVRRNANGSVSGRYVQSAEEARAFLAGPEERTSPRVVRAER